MALEFDRIRDRKPDDTMERARVRMFLTADRSRIVGEGDPDAAILYAAPGSRLPPDAVEKFGLVGGELPVKQAAKPANKQAAKPANKRKG